MNNSKKQQGFSVIELVIAAAVIVVGLGGVLGVAAISLIASSVAKQTTEATFLAQEEMEALGNYRDGVQWSDDDPFDEYDGFEHVALGTDYHAEKDGAPPRWKLVTPQETVGMFQRAVRFAQVCRDANDDIAPCPASYTDTDTIDAAVTVSWTERGRAHQIELVKYFTNWN